jgi:hypothetical protein
MRTRAAISFIPVIALALAACSGSGSGPTGPTSTQPVAVATLVATSVPEATATTASSEPAESQTGGGSAPPTPTDPCDLLTQDEAKTLIGANVGPGVSSLVDQVRVCTFKKGTTEVKLFLAPLAPDAATAQAYWDAERAQVPADLPVADVPGFDRAAFGAGSAHGISISALFVIQGTQFFDLFCGFPGCTEGASVTAANLIVSRLP